jgi:hypothetical protein
LIQREVYVVGRERTGMVDIDSDTLFNGAAAVVTTAAVVMFTLNVDFAYSPVSKVALVAAFLACVFLITQRTDDDQLALFGYGVVVASAVTLFFEVVNTFGFDTTATVLGLLVIAAALFGLRSLLGDDNRFVTGRRAAYGFGVVAAFAAVILVVDVATGGLAYELQPEAQVEFDDARREEVRVATVVVTNPTPFPERVETPDYEVCAAGDWSEYRPPSEPGEPERVVEAYANVQDGYDEFVFGFGTKSYPVTLYVHAENVTGQTFPVRTTADCPDDETGAPYVALFEASDRDRYGYYLL